jgi:Uma2 family endonuclease
MSITTLISVDQYLHTSYSPDRDYVDGEVQKRNLGEFDHATLQMAISAWFFAHRREWNILVLPEQRVQVSAKRFRIPDVSILPGDYSKAPIVRVPPLICIEVQSRDDILRQMRERVTDYLNFGVRHVWIFDPALREAFIADRDGYHVPAGGVFRVPQNSDPPAAPANLRRTGLNRR